MEDLNEEMLQALLANPLPELQNRAQETKWASDFITEEEKPIMEAWDTIKARADAATQEARLAVRQDQIPERYLALQKQYVLLNEQVRRLANLVSAALELRTEQSLQLNRILYHLKRNRDTTYEQMLRLERKGGRVDKVRSANTILADEAGERARQAILDEPASRVAYHDYLVVIRRAEERAAQARKNLQPAIRAALMAIEVALADMGEA